MKFWSFIERKPQSQRQAYLLAIVLMCISSLLWAFLERFPSMIPPSYVPYELVWTRYGTHLLLMLVLMGPRQRHAVVHTPRLSTHIIRSLLMFGMPVLFIAALRHHAPVSFVWSVTWLAVPIAMATSAFGYRETAPLSLWFTAIIGLIGTWMMLGSPLPKSPDDVAIGLCVPFCYGIYIAMTRELRSEPISTNLFHTALWVFLLLTLIMPFVWQPLTINLVLVMAVVGLIGWTVLLLLDRALAYAPVAVVAPFVYTESAWGFANEWLRHGMTPTTVEFLGMCLVVVMCVGILVYVFTQKEAESLTQIAAPASSEEPEQAPCP